MSRVARPRNVLIYLSLYVVTFACQTSKSQEETRNSAELRATQIQLIKTSLDQGRPQEALQELRPLLKTAPEDPLLQSLMGFTQLALRNTTKAVGHMRKAYKLAPTTPNGLNLTAALIEIGQLDQASKILNGLKSTAETYDFPERIYHNLGYVEEKQKRFKTALQYYERALKENPTFYPSLVQIGRVHFSQEKHGLALQFLRKAMDYCHVCLEPVELSVYSYMKLGQVAHARETLQKYQNVRGVEGPDKVKAGNMLKLIAKVKAPLGRTAGK
jgi:Tfp pilus assembly protein PilF